LSKEVLFFRDYKTGIRFALSRDAPFFFERMNQNFGACRKEKKDGSRRYVTLRYVTLRYVTLRYVISDAVSTILEYTTYVRRDRSTLRSPISFLFFVREMRR
jgi:hypothetical protein